MNILFTTLIIFHALSFYASVTPTQVLNEVQSKCSKVWPGLNALHHLGFSDSDLRDSVRYLGPSIRLRHKLLKAITPNSVINVVVLGGSISCGSGTEGSQDSYLQVFKNWWVHNFGAYSTLNFTNACIPATGSEYFKHCFHSYVTSDTDLVILELAVNDQFFSPDSPSSINFDPEILLRTLLDMPQKPAVLAINFLAPLHDLKPGNSGLNGGDIFDLLAPYYDIPSVSPKFALFTKSRPYQCEYYNYTYKDDVHPNEKGHLSFGLMLSSVVRKVMCEVVNDISASPDASRYFDSVKNSSIVISDFATDNFRFPNNGFTTPLYQTYSTGILYKFNNHQAISLSQCISIQGLTPMLEPINATGWSRFVTLSASHHQKAYWRAEKANSKIVFNIDIRDKDTNVYLYILRAGYLKGEVECYIDNRESGVEKFRGSGHSGSSAVRQDTPNVGRLFPLKSTAIAKGKHLLICESGSDPNIDFRLIAIIISSF